MPRFYFHIVREGECLHDEEGIDLDNIEAAKAEAFASARELGMEAMRAGRAIDADRIEVRDETDNLLLVVPVRSVTA